MTIFCWAEYVYYDGLMGFSQIHVTLDPDSPIVWAKLRWLNSEVEVKRA